MKITIISSEYDINGGGLAFQCKTFVEMLTRLGYDPIIVSSLPDNVVSGGYNPSLGFELAMEEKVQLDSLKYSMADLIIAFGGGMNCYYATQLAKKIKARLWIMFRGSDANLCKWNTPLAEMNRQACSQAERVISLSKEIRNNLISLGVSKDKIVIIPNYATKVAEVKCDFNKTNIKIGVGATNLNEKKGVVRLIKMTAQYNRIHPERPVYLELAGHVDEDYLVRFQSIANIEGVMDKVTFLGKVNRQEFTHFLKEWDLYIQASICEGMGNSITEAMSVGKPVLISRTGYIAEMAEELFPDMIFETLFPEDMAKSLDYILTTPDIEANYHRFYEYFFTSVSQSVVEREWEWLLSFRKPTCSVTNPSNCILSVVLHDVTGDKHDNITTPVRVFTQFVEDVYKAGYRLCSMSQYLSSNNSERYKLIVCTFDDGYEGLLLNALPILNQYGFSASVFVCTDYLGKTNRWNYKDRTIRKHLDVDQLRILQSNGWEIGSHGVTHESLLRLSDDELKIQLGDSKKILESLLGPIHTYAYPYGDYSTFIEKQVKKYYESAFLLTEGGVYLAVDTHRIHRYYISEIYEIIGCK